MAGELEFGTSQWQVDPAVQAERDAKARELIQMESDNPDYQVTSLDTVNPTSVKAQKPLPDTRSLEFAGDIKHVSPPLEFGKSEDTSTVADPSLEFGKPSDPTQIIPGDHYQNETAFDRAGQRFLEHGVGEFNKFKETFMSPGEHPEYGAYKALADMVPQIGASVGFGAETVLKHTLPGVSGLEALKGLTGQPNDMLGDAIKWKTEGAGWSDAMTKAMPDYFQKELAKPGAKAAAELVGLPMYPIQKGTEAIGEKYGSGYGAVAEHLLNLGMVAVPAAMKKGGAVAKDPVAEAFKSFVDKYKDIDPEQVHASSLADLASKLDDALPPTRQKYIAPDDVPLEEHLTQMVEGGNHSIVNVLDAIANSEQQPRVHRELAGQLAELGHQLGLDNILAEPLPKEHGSAGQYRPADDAVTLKPGRQGIVETAIHEATHAVTNGLLEMGRIYKDADLKHNPQAAALVEKAQTWTRLWDATVDAQAKAERMTKEDFLAKLNDIKEKKKAGTATAEENTYFNSRYGFTDPHEFASEFLVDKQFQDLLKEHTIRAEDLPSAKVQTPHGRVSAFQGARAYFNSLVAKAPGVSMAGVLADHLFDLMSSAKIQERAHFTEGEALQRAVDRSKAMDSMEAGFQTSASVMEKMAMGRIANLRKSAPTFTDFLIRLKADAYFKGDHDFILNYARRLWDHPEMVERLGGESGFKSLPPEVQKWASDPRDINTFIKEEFTDKGITSIALDQDISRSGTWFLNPSTLEMTKFSNGPAGKIMRWVYSKTREIQSLKSQVYEEGTSHLKSWNGLKRNEQLELWDAMQEWNKPEKSRELKAKGEQWIPDNELKAKGLSDAQIEAYHGITDLLDYQFEVVNEAMKRIGLQPMEKIPGYIPNVHEGAYKVFVKMTQPDTTQGKGFSKSQIVTVKGFSTRRGAERFARELESGVHDKGDVTVRPEYQIDDVLNKSLPYRITKFSDIEQPLGAAFHEYQTAYKNQLSLAPELLQVVENLQSKVEAGMIKSGMERSSVSGYRGEFGYDRSTLSTLLEKANIGAPINTRMIKTFENSMKQASEYYGNSIFLKEVKEPIMTFQPMKLDGRNYYGQLTQHLQNLQRYMEEYGMNFVGEPRNAAKWIDDQLQRTAIKIGVNPNIARQSLRSIRNYLSLVSLRANPRNYAANLTQFAHTLEVLQYAAAGFEKEGIKGPNVLDSLANSMKAMDPDMLAAIKWAKDTHVLDPQLEAQMHTHQGGPLARKINYVTGGEINPWIEGYTREATFRIAYEHMRRTFPDRPEVARDAAVKVMRMVMVDYNRAERPGMYNNAGIVSEALSPFAVFRNAWAGNQFMMIEKALQDRSFTAIKPLLTTQLMFWTLAGTMGMIGIADYNNLVNLINKFIPEYQVPRMEEILMKAGDVPVVGSLLSSDAMIYGPLSNSTKYIPGLESGINLSTSQTAPGPTDLGNLPIVDFVKSMGLAVGIAGKQVLSSIPQTGLTPPNKDDIWGAFRPITPSILRPQLEKALKGDLRIAPQSKDLTGTVERNASDQNIYEYTGGESIKVGREKSILANLAQGEKQRKDAIKDLVKVLVDDQMGVKTNPLTSDEITRRWGELSKDPISKLGELVVEGKNQRMLSQRQRIAQPLTQDSFRESLKLQQMERQR